MAENYPGTSMNEAIGLLVAKRPDCVIISSR